MFSRYISIDGGGNQGWCLNSWTWSVFPVVICWPPGVWISFDCYDIIITTSEISPGYPIATPDVGLLSMTTEYQRTPCFLSEARALLAHSAPIAPHVGHYIYSSTCMYDYCTYILLRTPLVTLTRQTADRTNVWLPCRASHLI
jgi:hypothetical protein